jgi:hypothetical protein
MQKAEFVATIAPHAVEDMMETGVMASITLAQAALESAWGTAAPGNNLFGIKGSGTAQDTQEYINGEWVAIKAGFRAYPDWLGSIADHSAFLIQNGRYARAGFFERCASLDFQGAAKALQAAGYATDPDYAAKLITIITTNGFYKYDLEAVQNMKAITELQGQVQTLLNTAEAHVVRIDSLEQQVAVLQERASQSVPDWAQDAVAAAVSARFIDTPNGGSYDFYRLLTILYRAGKL